MNHVVHEIGRKLPTNGGADHPDYRLETGPRIEAFPFAWAKVGLKTLSLPPATDISGINFLVSRDVLITPSQIIEELATGSRLAI